MSAPSSEAFADWLRRIRAGEREALGALFRATYPALLRYARSLTPRQDLAEDTVQHAFTQVWRKRDTLHPEGSLRALLYTTVRHRTLNKMRNAQNRRERADDEIDPSPAPPAPDASADAELLGAHIRSWIDELPERRREAFRLSRFDQLSYREIADVMDVSVRTVESHVRHALAHLRDRLRAFEPDRLNR